VWDARRTLGRKRSHNRIRRVNGKWRGQPVLPGGIEDVAKSS